VSKLGKFIYDIPARKMPDTQELVNGVDRVLKRGFAFQRPDGRIIYIPPSSLGDETQMLTKPDWTTDYGSIPKPCQNIFSPTR